MLDILQKEFKEIEEYEKIEDNPVKNVEIF
jgi:hypothetical protein